MVYQVWQLLCLACYLSYTKMKRWQEIQWMKRYVKQENNTNMIQVENGGQKETV